jgi:hypothetical protein
VLWKNGLPTEIEKTVVASSVVQLDGNDVYVSATIDSISGFRTKFWKNGIAKGSYRDSPESTTFTVFDGDVYSTNQDTYSPFANYMFNFKQIVVREPSANSFSLISQIIVR